MISLYSCSKPSSPFSGRDSIDSILLLDISCPMMAVSGYVLHLFEYEGLYKHYDII